VPYGLELPSNVALIDLGSEGMAQRLASIIPEEIEEEDDGERGKKGKGKGKGNQKGRGKDKQKHQREQLRKALPRALRRTPYMLIQFKVTEDCLIHILMCVWSSCLRGLCVPSSACSLSSACL
jgi:hypothetical protein